MFYFISEPLVFRSLEMSNNLCSSISRMMLDPSSSDLVHVHILVVIPTTHTSFILPFHLNPQKPPSSSDLAVFA